MALATPDGAPPPLHDPGRLAVQGASHEAILSHFMADGGVGHQMYRFEGVESGATTEEVAPAEGSAGESTRKLNLGPCSTCIYVRAPSVHHASVTMACAA